MFHKRHSIQYLQFHFYIWSYREAGKTEINRIGYFLIMSYVQNYTMTPKLWHTNISKVHQGRGFFLAARRHLSVFLDTVLLWYGLRTDWWSSVGTGLLRLCSNKFQNDWTIIIISRLFFVSIKNCVLLKLGSYCNESQRLGLECYKRFCWDNHVHFHTGLITFLQKLFSTHKILLFNTFCNTASDDSGLSFKWVFFWFDQTDYNKTRKPPGILNVVTIHIWMELLQ